MKYQYLLNGTEMKPHQLFEYLKGCCLAQGIDTEELRACWQRAHHSEDEDAEYAVDEIESIDNTRSVELIAI